MGMKSKSVTEEKLPVGTQDFRGAAAPAPKTVAPAVAASTDSGTAAAVARLNKTTTASPVAGKTYAAQQDEVARGKTRCAMFAAALMSPALAGAKWDTTEQFLELVQKAAEAGVKYSFQD